MTIRMQVTIPAIDHARAQERARSRGISLAEYLRQLVRYDLEDGPQTGIEISDLFGIGDSGGSDIARDKDTYLGEALAAGKAPQ